MLVIDALSFSLSVLGIYGLILSLRYLIPCYMVPFLSVRLNEAQQLLSHAEAINAIPPGSEHRTYLDLCGDFFFFQCAVISYMIYPVLRINFLRCACRAITPDGHSCNCALLFSMA